MKQNYLLDYVKKANKKELGTLGTELGYFLKNYLSSPDKLRGKRYVDYYYTTDSLKTEILDFTEEEKILLRDVSCCKDLWSMFNIEKLLWAGIKQKFNLYVNQGRLVNLWDEILPEYDSVEFIDSLTDELLEKEEYGDYRKLLEAIH